MSNTAVVGINWGDEGKGRMIDYLIKDYDIVARFQGGGNAGHTVINEYGKTALHLIPTGIFSKGVMNILGNGVALDPENLIKEMETIREKGIEFTKDNFMISDRASMLMPWHRYLDELEENRLKDKKYGSTKQGIAPFYSDRYAKKTVAVGELFYEKELFEHLRDLIEYKNMIIRNVYGGRPYTFDEIRDWVHEYGNKIKSYISDTRKYLNNALKNNKKILFEAQLGSLKDLDFGIYPYTTSSNTIAKYAPIGTGCTKATIDKIIGIVKAYSTCVGEGPFVSEMKGEEAENLRTKGNEFGAKTGRPRRVGALDIVATKYGIEVQTATEIAITKLDTLSYMDKIPVCTHYELDGKKTDEFPFPSQLKYAKPVIEYLKGWQCDISNIKNWNDLPQEAKDYVLFIEKNINCPITYISVGPERESIILREV